MARCLLEKDLLKKPPMFKTEIQVLKKKKKTLENLGRLHPHYTIAIID